MKIEDLHKVLGDFKFDKTDFVVWNGIEWIIIIEEHDGFGTEIVI